MIIFIDGAASVASIGVYDIDILVLIHDCNTFILILEALLIIILPYVLFLYFNTHMFTLCSHEDLFILSLVHFLSMVVFILLLGANYF